MPPPRAALPQRTTRGARMGAVAAEEGDEEFWVRGRDAGSAVSHAGAAWQQLPPLAAPACNPRQRTTLPAGRQGNPLIHPPSHPPALPSALPALPARPPACLQNQEFFAEEANDERYETESEPEDRVDADFDESVR